MFMQNANVHWFVHWTGSHIATCGIDQTSPIHFDAYHLIKKYCRFGVILLRLHSYRSRLSKVVISNTTAWDPQRRIDVICAGICFFFRSLANFLNIFSVRHYGRHCMPKTNAARCTIDNKWQQQMRNKQQQRFIEKHTTEIVQSSMEQFKYLEWFGIAVISFE